MRIGIDLGGTKIEIIVLDSQNQIIFRKRVDTPQHNYIAILDTIKKLVETTENAVSEKCSIGIGTPGSLSPASGLLRNSNSVCLNQQPFKDDLQKYLQREIRISNDANCFALSEASDGAAAGADVVFGVIVGTGTGAGVVVHGKMLNGPHGIAGEWGHNPLPWPQDNERPGPDCYCGKQGCIEAFLSGPGMAADYYLLNQQKLSAKEIVEKAAQGDIKAEQCVQRYEHRMARALAHVINILDPDVIVLGGGMSNIQRLYQNIPELWREFVFSDVVLTRLVPPEYGDSSGVRGAAWLWPR